MNNWNCFCSIHDILNRGARWRSWLRHCATSRKVAGSIPNGVIEIFHWHNPSGRTMALASTQPLTEMSTRIYFLEGKRSRCVGLTTLPPSCAEYLKIRETSGSVRACNGIACLQEPTSLYLESPKFCPHPYISYLKFSSIFYSRLVLHLQVGLYVSNSTSLLPS